MGALRIVDLANRRDGDGDASDPTVSFNGSCWGLVTMDMIAIEPSMNSSFATRPLVVQAAFLDVSSRISLPLILDACYIVLEITSIQRWFLLLPMTMH